MDRRDFMHWSAAFALSATPAAATAPTSASPAAPAFSGRLARIAFLDDVASLAAVSPALSPATARAILTHRPLFLAGAALQSAGAQPDQAAALAASRAASAAWLPLAPTSAPAGLQRDARLLRELASRATQHNGRPSAPSARDIVSLLDAMSRRTLIAIHTYIPDEKDVEGWMDRLIRLHDDARAYQSQLAQAFLAARPLADSFYDAADPIIRAAAVVDFGPLQPAAIQSAFASRPASAYGRALLDAHTRLLQA